MPPINIAPTRSNLIRVKKDLQFAHEGNQILDWKREVSTTDLVRVAHEAEVLQQAVWKRLLPAYRGFGKGAINDGK